MTPPEGTATAVPPVTDWHTENDLIMNAITLEAHSHHSELQRDLYRAAIEAANHLMEVDL